MQKNQNRQSKFAFAKVGPERFAGRALSAGEIEAIIVNLVRSPDLHSEIPGRLDHVGIGLTDYRGQLRCG